MGKSVGDNPSACGVILGWFKRHPEFDLRIDSLLVSINDRLKILNPEVGMDIEPLSGEILDDYLQAIMTEVKVIKDGRDETDIAIERSSKFNPSDWPSELSPLDS